MYSAEMPTAAAHFSAQRQLVVGGTMYENLRGWTAATVEVNGVAYRFVNTHLESQQFRAVQEAQARELAALLADESLPAVLTGDLNSAANPSSPEEWKTDSYHVLRNAGLADIALREPHSADLVTCCRAPDLSDYPSTFDQRLDLVLVRFGRAGFAGQSSLEVVADDRFEHAPLSSDSPAYHLWPSDHAAVYATIWPAPGRGGANPAP